MKVNRKKVLWVITGIIVLSLIAWPKVKTLFNKKDNEKNAVAQKSKSTVKVLVIAYDNLREVLKSSGTLISDEEVDVTFETSGKLTHIYFTEGTRVNKGDLLAKLRDDDLQAQLSKLDIQHKLASEKVVRQKALLDKDAVSKESYDQVFTELQEIEAEIKLINAHIAETEIRAPFSGIIGLRYVSEGAFVNPNTFIARLVKIQPLKIDFAVPERYAGLVKNGNEVNFYIEPEKTPYQAKVYAIEPKIDPKTRTLTVRALYANQGELLQPGRFVSVELIVREKSQALQIPSQSIIPESGKEKVFLIKNGLAEPVIIKTGMRTQAYVEILEGLNPGDTLVVSGIMQLKKGSPVQIIN